MKTKNLSLALIAFTFAIGSAFASMFAFEDVYVKAKMSSEADAPTECINTLVQCDNAGEQVCTVQVPLQTGTQIAKTSGSIFTYKASCTVVLGNANSATIVSPLSGSAKPFALVAN